MSETPGKPRYQRTSGGLVGALLITLAVVVAFVLFRAVTRDNAEVRPEAVDYLDTVGAVQTTDTAVAYPPTLPAGWIPTSADFEPGRQPRWNLGILTTGGSFLGLVQQDEDLDDLLATYVDEDPTEGDDYTAPAGAIAPTWQTWSDAGGDRAYSAEVGGDTVLVYGSAPAAEQERLIGLLTTDRLP